MSFGPKKNESKDVAKLRAEYEAKATAVRDTKDAASVAKLIDEKRKAHVKLVNQISGERKEVKESLQKVLVQQGTMKTKEQHQREVEAAKARSAQG